MFEALTYLFFAAFVADAMRSLTARQPSAAPRTTKPTPTSPPDDPTTPA